MVQSKCIQESENIHKYQQLLAVQNCTYKISTDILSIKREYKNEDSNDSSTKDHCKTKLEIRLFFRDL